MKRSARVRPLPSALAEDVYAVLGVSLVWLGCTYLAAIVTTSVEYGSPGLSNTWLRMAEWANSSAAAVPWLAPFLTSTIAVLFGVAAARVEKRETSESSPDLRTLAAGIAHIIAGTMVAWLILIAAAAGATELSADMLGLIVLVPLAVLGSLAAGRYVVPEAKTRAKAWTYRAKHLEAETAELRARALPPSRPRLAMGPWVAVSVAAVSADAVIFIVSLVITSSVLSAAQLTVMVGCIGVLCAASSGLLAQLLTQPSGAIWAHDQNRYTLTRLGAVAVTLGLLAVSIPFTVLIGVLAASIGSSAVSDRPGLALFGIALVASVAFPIVVALRPGARDTWIGDAIVRRERDLARVTASLNRLRIPRGKTPAGISARPRTHHRPAAFRRQQYAAIRRR